MRIGIDASRANSAQRTGVENYAYFVIENLKKIIGYEHHVVLYSREPLQGELAALPEHWESRVLRMPLNRFWTQVRLSWELWRHPVDALFVPAHVIPLVHPKKTIVTIHDIAPKRYPQSYSWFEAWYGVWSTRYALRQASTIVVPSQFTKDEIKHFFPRSHDVIQVIPAAYDVNRFNREVDEHRTAQLLVREGIQKPYVLFVGRIEGKKDLSMLVEAYSNARRSVGMPFQLVLAGKPGYGYREVQQAIAASPFHEDIIQLGYVADQWLPHLYQGAHALAFMTQYEGFGIPILEAMAVGTHVIVKRGDACEEVARGAAHLVDGSLESLTAALHHVVNTEDEHTKNLDEVVQHYSWEKCAKAIAQIITK